MSKAPVKAAPRAKTFEDGPWGQKFMHGVDKKAASDAADRAGQTIPAWLTDAIREKIAREREPQAVNGSGGGLLTIDNNAQNGLHLMEPLTLTAEEIIRTVEVAEEIAKRRGKTLRPNARIYIGAERACRTRLVG